MRSSKPRWLEKNDIWKASSSAQMIGWMVTLQANWGSRPMAHQEGEALYSFWKRDQVPTVKRTPERTRSDLEGTE